MLLCDAHAHLGNDTEWEERTGKGILSLICATGPEEAGKLFSRLEWLKGRAVIPTAGLHPWYADQYTVQDMEPYIRRCPVVGEIGMDLYWDKTFLREQQRVLDKQIEWALEYGLPVVLHCREAFDHIYNVLKPYQQTPLKGIFHSFTGTSEEACRIMEFADFMIGIDGVVTFKKSTLPEVLKNIPLERIVLETDSPYLTPVPNRGKRNESAYVKDTLVKVAGIYGNSPEKVAQVTSDNALKVFGMLK